MTEPSKEPNRHVQDPPGQEHFMNPRPKFRLETVKGSGKLTGKVALITGGDSGIGRAVAVQFAREGAQIAIQFLPEERRDAEETKMEVENEGQSCILIPGNLANPKFCQDLVEMTIQNYGKLDILVNNAAYQDSVDDIEDLTDENIDYTFRVNIMAQIRIVRAALPHLKSGASIINTSSINAYRGHPTLLDYTATKGAIVSFTRSLAENLVHKGITVNSVAPGPIWTPLIPSSFDEKKLQSFGKNVPMGRAGHPEEVAPAFVFLASQVDSNFITGQTIHVNGGAVVNG